MKGTFYFSCLTIISILRISFPQQSRGQEDQSQIGCQQRSTLGRDYVGKASTDVADGIPCQKWSDTEPHDHSFTHVGDYNLCRNPKGAGLSHVLCYTTDPDHEKQNCSVSFCPPLKALDFSLDNDQKPDKGDSYTHASLKKENLAPSFTICTAFMLEAWNEYADAKLVVLRDDNGDIWNWVQIFAKETYTEFIFQIRTFSRIHKTEQKLVLPTPLLNQGMPLQRFKHFPSKAGGGR